MKAVRDLAGLGPAEGESAEVSCPWHTALSGAALWVAPALLLLRKANRKRGAWALPALLIGVALALLIAEKVLTHSIMFWFDREIAAAMCQVLRTVTLALATWFLIADRVRLRPQGRFTWIALAGVLLCLAGVAAGQIMALPALAMAMMAAALILNRFRARERATWLVNDCGLATLAAAGVLLAFMIVADLRLNTWPGEGGCLFGLVGNATAWRKCYMGTFGLLLGGTRSLSAYSVRATLCWLAGLAILVFVLRKLPGRRRLGLWLSICCAMGALAGAFPWVFFAAYIQYHPRIHPDLVRSWIWSATLLLGPCLALLPFLIAAKWNGWLRERLYDSMPWARPVAQGLPIGELIILPGGAPGSPGASRTDPGAPAP